MQITTLVLIATATVAATIAHPAGAQAEPTHPDGFQSPSGNIQCSVRINTSGSRFTGKSEVYCDIRDYTWTAVDCNGQPADIFFLRQGESAGTLCDPTRDSRTKQHIPGAFDRFDPGLPTLDYGQTRSAGPITCDSEPAGVTCTDTSTGHYFQLARESYELR
jgi:hypothetical protein